MAEQAILETDVTPVQDVVRGLAAELLNPQNAEKVKKLAQDIVLEASKDHAEFSWDGAAWAAGLLARAVLNVINAPEPVYNELARAAIGTLLGGDQARESLPHDAGRKLIDRLSGGAGEMTPGVDGAANYLTLILNESMEAWVRGLAVEIVSEMVPRLTGVGGGVETFAKLEEIIEGALGGQRMIRRVIQPFMNATAITPAQWHVNKKYRPELLSTADTVRQLHRKRWPRERVFEELARQGWSDERIEALINAQRKFFSAGDVRLFVERRQWTGEQGRQHLLDQGYDEAGADDALRLEGLRRVDQLETAEANALITAYVNRDITRAEFTAQMGTSVSSPTERALLEELADLRYALNVRRLTAADARRLARARILSVVDYRRALEREGFDDFSVTALELELRVELDDKKRLEEHRAELEAERAAEKRARAEERAQRKVDVEAERALRRRGPLGDLERAAVRGLIPFARVEEVLAAQYDGDTVEILLGLVEEDRQRYIAQQAAADVARQKALRRDLDVGALEAAVMANLLTVDEFRGRLTFLKFDPADAALLADTLAVRKADRDAAIQQRRDAEEAAQHRSIDLGRFERLVRRGVRSLDAYDDLLDSLGFDDGARAAMRELLELEIADDRKADALRAEAEMRLRVKGLSLEQFRRAVVLGTKTVDDYNRFLVDQGFTADAVAALVADVEAAVADAEAARQRRSATGATTGARALPLSTIARAARLGIVHPATYQARLEAAGYSADDVAIELELLLTEIADVQAARARRDALEADAQTRGLSLAQVERAVKAGVANLEDYRAQAITIGYAPDDVLTLVAILEQELGAAHDAGDRRGTIEDELATRHVSLSQLEEAVKKDLKTVDDFAIDLSALGYGAEDVELLVALLVTDLEAAAAKAAGG